MQRRDARLVVPDELRPQEIHEERVIAIPLAVVVECDEEEVGALELLEQVCRVVPACDGISERRADGVEDRRIEEKAAPFRVERIEHDLGQVVDNVPIRAAESGDELGRMLGLLERQGCKLDAGRPTLSALVERGERFPVEPEADPLVQVEILLLCGEAEVNRSKLEQLPPARSVASMMGGSARVAIASVTFRGSQCRKSRMDS